MTTYIFILRALGKLNIFLDFFIIYNFIIIHFASKVKGTKMLTNCKIYILENK